MPLLKKNVDVSRFQSWY
uniref:Uncharacterized protein n=1 Tax=Rhizophora mucronata TaxID=61149 RepID=A0A2P2NBF9_RHIMU